MTNIGYACINMTLGKKGILTGRAMRAATLKEKGLAHASQLALANAKEVQDGPKQFIVQELEDIGDDLAEGILAIDGARYLLTKFNKAVKDIKHAKNL